MKPRTTPGSSEALSAFWARLKVTGMQSVRAVCPVVTCLPRACQRGYVASGPGSMPRAVHWANARSMFPMLNE